MKHLLESITPHMVLSVYSGKINRNGKHSYNPEHRDEAIAEGYKVSNKDVSIGTVKSVLNLFKGHHDAVELLGGHVLHLILNKHQYAIYLTKWGAEYIHGFKNTMECNQN